MPNQTPDAAGSDATRRPPAVHVVVPMKPLSRAKSRLAPRLSPAERHDLALLMLHAVLSTLDTARPLVQAVWVISSDALVLRAAHAHGAHGLHDPTSELNAALELAKGHAAAQGAGALLVLPADMPLLSSSDVGGLVAALLAPPTSSHSRGICVLAPNEDASGTNALGLTLPTPMACQFGPASFAQHQASAERLGLELRLYRSPTLAFDVDTPADVERIWHMQHQERRQIDGNHRLCCGP
jgi:2-phospho-L-lactate guanylyltransferase